MKKQILFGLLAAGMLAACSSDDSLSENGNVYDLVEGQSAFISLGIAMPGDVSSRANDDFADGADAEYAVKSGTLVLFKGTSEADAKIFGSYDITSLVSPTGTFTTEGTNDDQITSTSKKFVQEISAPSLTSAEKLFAYVILNDKNNAPGIPTTIGTEFSAFNNAVLTAIGITTESKGYGAQNANGLVMTNTAFSTAGGGASAPASTAAVQTLIPIEATAVYDTKAEAEASTADVACIYVERAAVKVDVTFNATTESVSSMKAELVGWCLGNTNNSASGYYNIRQVDPAWFPLFNKAVNSSYASKKYRFVCGSPFFASGHTMGYRTYFGKDVNYNGNTGLVNAQCVAANDDLSSKGDYTLASGGSTFTYENTFDENSQMYKNTTYVSFLVKLNEGNTFYTIKGAENTAYTTQAALKNKLGENMRTQLSTELSTITTTIQSKIAADISGSNTIGATTGVTFDIEPIVTLASAKDANANLSYTVAIDFANVKVDDADATSTQLAAINALIYEGTTTIAEKLAAATTGKTLETVTEYTNGLTYYATRIGHFHDIETPWSTGPESYDKYADIYPTDGQSVNESPSVDYGTSRANAWLGRWGIVRNNWYSLTVSAINGIGDAIPVNYSGDATPDDNPEPKYYIAAHIHILPWVKRTQNVILK